MYRLDKDFYAKLHRLSMPIMLQSLMLSLVAVADAVMLGRIHQDYMAAVSLASQIQFVQNMLISSLVTAGSILGAQYYGKGDKGSIEKIFCIMLRICGVISALFCCACLFTPSYLMMIFTSDNTLINIGAGYLKIAGWSYLLTGLSQCYLAIMKVTDHVAPAAFISSMAVILNVIFNAFLIFGLAGFDPMYANGAALATLSARIIEFVFCFLMSYKVSYIRPSLKNLLSYDRLLSGDYKKCALPLLGGGLFWGVGFTSYTAIIGHMGADATAANSVASVVRELICCACNGISAGGGIMVGNELGAGKLEKGKEYGIRIAKYSFVIAFVSMLIILLITRPVLNLMVMNDTSRRYLFQMMLVTSVYIIGRCVNTILINGIFASGGDTLFDVYSLAVTMWCIAIPLAVAGAFVFHWPVAVVYACTCIDEVGKIPWVLIHFRRYKWVKDLTRGS